MNRKFFHSALLLITLASVASACSSEHQSQRANAPAPGALQEVKADVQTSSAAESIAESRCERERHCDNIGDNKKYSSASDCIDRIRADWKDDLNARECPGGINQNELSECVMQVRAEACGNPFDTLARITECTSGQICIEQPKP